MNQLQIKYFLTAARCLNFTEAAKQLYISQPALSQQISTLENDLNMQLFIRSKNKLRLTPAGLTLLEELPKYETFYAEILKKAQFANEGTYGMLRIGFLQGQMMGDMLQERYMQFVEKYPGIGLDLYSLSFGELKKQLEEHKLDIIYTVDFDVEGKKGYIIEPVQNNPPVALVSKRHPLAKQDITTFQQLKNETFIVMQGFESRNENNLILEDCKKAGFIPNMKFASSLDEQMLWIEAGVGVGFSNVNSYGSINPNHVKLKLETGNCSLVFAWLKSNTNPAIALFDSFVVEYMKQKL